MSISAIRVDFPTEGQLNVRGINEKGSTLTEVSYAVRKDFLNSTLMFQARANRIFDAQAYLENELNDELKCRPDQRVEDIANGILQQFGLIN